MNKSQELISLLEELTPEKAKDIYIKKKKRLHTPEDLAKMEIEVTGPDTFKVIIPTSSNKTINYMEWKIDGNKLKQLSWKQELIK